MLGDELGVSSQDSMCDLTAALRAYRQIKILADRASGTDPKGNAHNSFVAYYGRIAELDGFIDPDHELDDTREGLREIAALPFQEQQSLRSRRSRMYLLIMQIDALLQLGRYAEARTVADYAVSEGAALAAADPQDQTAQLDLTGGLDRLAAIYTTAADPELGAAAEAQRRNLTAAEPILQRKIATLGAMQQNSSQQDVRPILADAEVRLGIVQYRLRKDPAAAGLVTSGLAIFRQICGGGQCSAMTLLDAAPDQLYAEPASLRDPKLALQYAQHAVELTHRKIPIMLLTLARTYRANGQTDLSRATAREALALLPPTRPHEGPTNLRRLLEKQTH